MTGWKEDAEGWKSAENTSWYKVKQDESGEDMTLDEAIKHAEEKADELGCTECANEHRQLAEWLKELKKYRNETQTK